MLITSVYSCWATSLSCMIHRTGTSLRKDLVSGLIESFSVPVKHNIDFCAWLAKLNRIRTRSLNAFAYMGFLVAWTVAWPPKVLYVFTLDVG